MVRGVERAASGAAVFSAQRFGHRMSLSVYRNPTVLPLAFGRLPATKGTQAIRILAVAAWDAEPGHHVEFLAMGDVNHDNEVNGLDVDPFVRVLLASRFDVAADMNGDGVVNGLDVDPFVAAVVGGTQPMPEPSTLLLVLIAISAIAGWRRRVG